MVDTHQVKHGGMHVVNMHGVLDDIVAEIVRLTVSLSAFDTATRHPGAEATRMVVATVAIFGHLALAVSRATKFTAPHHEGVFQEATLFQVFEEGRRGLIGLLALTLDGAR